MSGYRFEPGVHFLQQNREFVVEQYLTNDQLQVKDVATNEFTSQPVSALLDALFDNRLEMIGGNGDYQNLQHRLSKSRTSDLSLLDKDDPRKVEAYRRLEYIKEIKKRGLTTYTPKSLRPVINAVRKRIGDKKKQPSWSTVNRWRKDYEASGENVRALVPAHKARGNTNHKYSGIRISEFREEDIEKANAVANIVEKLVRTKYLTRQRRTVASVHEIIEAHLREDNKQRSNKDQLPILHISSLYNYIDTLDPYEVDVARYSKRYADQKHRTNEQGPRPKRPMQRVQADHTRMDLMVVDTKTRLPLGRPWLTTLIDLYSKLIIGIYLSFTPPSYLSVMQCLLHAIRPKAYVGKLYPEIEHTWDAYGIPEVIVVDNGKEFYSEDFDDACQQIGAEVEYAPRKAPWYKSSQERFYRTLNTGLLHELPGTTFSSIFEKKDYDPTKHVVISMDALLEVTHVWIIDVYHQSLHRGITDIPARKWKEGIKDWPPNLPPKKGELEILLGYKEHRSISSSGIEFQSLFYNCKELGLIRRKLRPNEKVIFKYDPTDISVVYVYDKSNDCYLPVPALDQEYTNKLTLWQHLVIRNYARKIAKSHVDRDALCRAKKHLQTIVERELLANKKISGSEKIARYLNLGQPNYVELIDEQEDQELEAVLNAASGEGMENHTQISTESSLNDISDFGETSITREGTKSEDPIEIRQIHEETLEELIGNISASEVTNGTNPQSRDKARVEIKASKRGKSADAGNRGNVRSNTGLFNHDADALDEEDWGADYELPL
jgi:putative transposase